MQMKYLINSLVFLSFLLGCVTQGTASSNGYVLTSSKVLSKGEENKLYLRRIGNLEQGTLNITLLYRSDFFSTEIPQISQEFPIPAGEAFTTLTWLLNKFETDYSYGTLKINGTFGDYSFTGYDSVKFVDSKQNIVIIQTDKPMYQPGKIVKFRILKVNKEFKPSAKNNIAEAYVLDPKRTNLFQFKNIDLVKGLAQNEFTLSGDPALGTWSINVTIADEFYSTHFDVDVYDPPTFEVKLNFPSYILSTEENILIEVCSKYTYGLPVKGMLNFTAFSLHSFYSHYGLPKKPVPVMNIFTQIHSCYQVDLYVPLIEPGDVYTYSRIEISAKVIEDGTGAEALVKKYLERTTKPLKLEFIDSLDYYKPGLPYNGKMKVTKPDDTPAANETVEICVRIDKEHIIAVWYAKREIEVCSNFTTNVRGIIPYTFLPQNLEDISITLEAKSLTYLPQNSSDTAYRPDSLEQPTATKNLKPYYSPTKSYIQIQASHEPVKCGTKQTFKVFYTVDENTTDFQFFYQVIYQETVVEQDSIKETFSPEADMMKKFKNSNAVIKGDEIQIEPDLSEIGNQSFTEFLNSSIFQPTKYQPPIGKVEVTVQIRQSLSPEFYFLIYYIKDNREIVADSRKLSVEKCFKNKVDLSFGDKKKQPGLETDIYIKASPNSLCGIKAIDQSDTIENSGDQITPDRLYQQKTSLFNDNYHSSNPCESEVKQPGLDNDAFKNISRVPIGMYGSANYVDSLTAFQDPNILIISDLFLATRPCKNKKMKKYHRASFYDDEYINEEYFSDLPTVEYTYGEYETSEEETAESKFDNEINSAAQFAINAKTTIPETWLFEMELTGRDGSFVATKQLPDIITDWVGRAVCLNLKDGLGISNDTYISAYKPFFIDYNLPFSAILGEELTLVVTIFNYETGALPVAISADNPGFTKMSSTEEVCVEPQGKTAFPIALRAVTLGDFNVTVQASTTSTHGVCGGASVSNIAAEDTVTKPITILAEGFPEENVINILACPSKSVNNAFQTTLTWATPKNVVPNSTSSYVDFVGDILGPAINNLENLVKLPGRDGESNMVRFVPNYLVLYYLTEIGQLTDGIRNRAINNLNTGYQRELKYRREDGSFSTFDSDEEGSIFLTAFVLRSFYQAQEFILIEDDVLQQMQDWLVSKQLDNGCFPNMDHTIDFDVQDGLTYGNSSGSLTAYVLASLVLTEFSDTVVIGKAFKCLKQNYPADPYTQLLYSYSEALINKLKEAQMHIDDARRHLSRAGGITSFTIENKTESEKIEATAYAVLSTLEMGKDPSLALPYINYLAKKFSSNGGFISIQDTCIGLEALTEFSELVFGDPLRLLIKTTGGLRQTVSINEDNRLLIQRYSVADTSKRINVLARGSGCALLQAVQRYNTEVPGESSKFSIDVIGHCSGRSCEKGIINVLVGFLSSELHSGKCIIEITLITGFVPDKESLNKVKSNEDNKILKVDVENNSVIFYLEETHCSFITLDTKVEPRTLAGWVYRNVVRCYVSREEYNFIYGTGFLPRQDRGLGYDILITNELDFSFQIQQFLVVKNRKPGLAKVYSYYAKDDSASTSYTVDGVILNGELY